jgi:Tol biopolymer transport system component
MEQDRFCLQPHRHEHIFVMQVDGSNQTQLTTGDATQRAYAPAWSRNGQRIAFATGPAGATVLGVMNSDGTQRELILDKKGNTINGTNPSFHPNGRQIVFNFAAENGATGSNIGVVRDNGKVSVLTNSGAGVFNTAPVYSPDGRFHRLLKRRHHRDARQRFQAGEPNQLLRQR